MRLRPAGDDPAGRFFRNDEGSPQAELIGREVRTISSAAHAIQLGTIPAEGSLMGEAIDNQNHLY